MKQLYSVVCLITLLFITATPAFAQIQPWDPTCIDSVTNIPKLTCIPSVFQNIVAAAFMFAGIVAVVFIMLSGIKFLTSGGDPKQVEGARQTMTYAIIGLILVVLSFAIIQLIARITGASCIQFFGYDACP